MFPETIDPNRVSERCEARPPNVWDYVEHEGFYYPKRTYKQLSTIWFLKSCNEEFGKSFESIDQFHAYSEDICTYIEQHTCEKCGFKTTTDQKMQSHKDSRNCAYRVQKALAAKRGELFVPDSQKSAFCGICNKPFLNKYCLGVHLKTDAHKDKANCIKIPTTCFCGKVFTGKTAATKFRRHLKEGRKCKVLANSTNENRIKWLDLHKRLKCKFPKAMVLIHNGPEKRVKRV
jgi:hypothetical protein